MSYRAYGVSTYGCVLNEEELRAAAKRFYEADDKLKTSGWEDLDDWHGWEDLDDWQFCEDLGLECITEFEGDVCCVDDDGAIEWDSYDSPSDVYYYGLRDPRLIGAAYKNFNEIVDECRAALGRFLPQDFDYRSHIRYIIGVVYG